MSDIRYKSCENNPKCTISEDENHEDIDSEQQDDLD